MNKKQKQRMIWIAIVAINLSIVLALVLYALKQNINVFLTPNDIITQHIVANYHFRLGGMVKKGSVMHEKQNLAIHFIVSDFKQEIPVYYHGMLPDLFREGTGVIAEGYLNQQKVFIATQLLAKHDENYMPKKYHK